jgi:hypothetical protein
MIGWLLFELLGKSARQPAIDRRHELSVIDWFLNELLCACLDTSNVGTSACPEISNTGSLILRRMSSRTSAIPSVPASARRPTQPNSGCASL